MSLIRPKNTGSKQADGRIRTQITVGGIKTVLVQRVKETEADFWSRVSATKEGEVRRMPTKGMKVETAWDIWIESKEKKLRPATLRSYKWIGDTYIKKMFGSIRIDNLEPIIVDRQLAKITKARTAKMTRDVGRAFYEYALKCGWSSRNAFKLADAISYTPEMKPIVTAINAEKVIAHADPRFQPIFLVMRQMGLRKSEAKNLMWSEIEGAPGDMWITLSQSKTQMGRQSIPVPELVENLLKYISRTSTFVFPGMGGYPYHERTITAKWHEACDAADVTRCPVYDLRDLFASEMAQRTDKDTLRRLMRHTDVRTTETHYIHVDRDRLQRSIKAKYKRPAAKVKKA
ncbi:MAG: tyrosine-type recombinase/integrase [Fimbriimonadaceae bacterium]